MQVRMVRLAARSAQTRPTSASARGGLAGRVPPLRGDPYQQQMWCRRPRMPPRARRRAISVGCLVAGMATVIARLAEPPEPPRAD
jgi:hypothetical protein